MTPRLRLSDPLLRVQTDERLAALTRHGGERAFAILVERHRASLLAFARRLGADGNAEDVVQQALLHAWSALERGTEVERVSAWLRQIVRNAAIRAAASRIDSTELPATLVAATETAGEVEMRERTRELLAEIERLPARQREALLQLAVGGASGAAVGAGMDLEANAVRQLAHRARTRLRAAVGALVPWPVALAAARGTHGLRIADGLPELAGGAGAAGGASMAGGVGIAKLGAVAATTAAVAVGTVGLASHHGSRHRAAGAPPRAVLARAADTAAGGPGSARDAASPTGDARHRVSPPARGTHAVAPVVPRTTSGGDRSSSGDGSSGSGDRSPTTSGSHDGSGDGSTTHASGDGGSSRSSSDGGSGSSDGGHTTTSTTSGSDGGSSTTSSSDGGGGSTDGSSSDGGSGTTTTSSGGDG